MRSQRAPATATYWSLPSGWSHRWRSWRYFARSASGSKPRSAGCGGAPVEGSKNPLTPLGAAGLIATLGTNSEFEIVRYLQLGEVVTSTMVIESVSERKQTRIGPGYFITWVTTFRDERGTVVGRQTFRVLKFKPDLEVLLK